MSVRTQSPRTTRVVAGALALVWLGAGLVAIVIAVGTSRWVPGVIGLASLWYGFLWVRVMKLGHQLKAGEAFKPWRIKPRSKA
jgi:hypothetical protein